MYEVERGASYILNTRNLDLRFKQTGVSVRSMIVSISTEVNKGMSTPAILC
jgi:hypothetical protein